MYGSLRADSSAHALLRGSHRCADGVVEGFQLHQHDGYPMLHRGHDLIAGEVYAISPTLWPALDAWEDAPTDYQRCQVSLKDGRRVWLYCAGEHHA